MLFKIWRQNDETEMIIIDTNTDIIVFIFQRAISYFF